MRVVDIILKKRYGGTLTKEEIHEVIDGYVKGIVPDYQVSALLMAICFQGLNDEEKVNLTMEMLHSGEQVDLSSIDGICVDKHSTGGVGDKTSLAIGPILAACGLKMAKMSGRGLGHTGGTLDKLESIPGCKINISSEDFFKQVKEVGVAIIGQTKNITPADKKLYALRDVTGTVDSIGLIASSIMSKKLASGAHYILIDVKVGDGAFMKDEAQARELSKTMVKIGNSLGRKTVCVLTNMNEPLGNAVGNSLEVIEAIETLKGKGPKDFTNLVYDLCSKLLVMTSICIDEKQARSLVEEKVASGEALEKLRQMIAFQGGNKDVTKDYTLFEKAKEIVPVLSEKSGYVKFEEALQIGLGAMLLGAGRENKEDDVDHAVGVVMNKKVGDYVKVGEPLAYLHTNGKGTKEAYDKVLNAFEIVEEVVEENKLILGVIE
ncbi:MAG: pyrimidine-nucleoside phosphorylase [Bacilli bacterium]|nr:pyrimidine-nucleoside phosphorylase [Bacilli bacterium]